MLRYLDGGFFASAPWLLGVAHLEDSWPDDRRPDSWRVRRRAAGPRRSQRSCDPAADHLLDGSDIGHCDAVVHLLGRVVWRRDHLDPDQYSGRGVVGSYYNRRLSDGAARQGRRGVDGGFLLGLSIDVLFLRRAWP